MHRPWAASAKASASADKMRGTVDPDLPFDGRVVGGDGRRVVQRGYEGVAAAVLGTNVPGGVRIVVERPPELADEHLDVVRLHVGVGPHRRQDALVRHDRAGAPRSDTGADPRPCA
jgi:hypothetical protein